MTIDCTLSKLIIPGFPEMVPEFGTKKADNVPSTAREATMNAMLPFARQRPFDITEDSGTSEIQAHTAFAVKTSGIALTLGSGGFVGCKASVFNLSAGAITVVSDGTARILYSGKSFELEWGVSGVWKLKNPVNHIVGEYRYFNRQISPFEMLEHRLLELSYQIIEIALYQELCDLMWVGPEGNDTADWWYKCDQDGARNENGLYMRVMDARGLFIRGAGANAVKTGANDTPYNGGAIGAFIGDAIRNLKGGFNATRDTNGLSMIQAPLHGLIHRTTITGDNIPLVAHSNYYSTAEVIEFDVSETNNPTSYENRPASISSCIVITY